MTQRLSIGTTVFIVLTAALGLYFAFAAVQGPSGLLRRIQIESEMAELEAQRDALRAEVSDMRRVRFCMSDEFLDLDLLDERARDVLGVMRADEVILR